MNRPLTIFLGLITLALAIGSVMLYQQNQRTEATLLSVQTSEQDAEQRYADAFRDIAEIQDSLNAITMNDGSQQLTSKALQSELKMAGPNRREALERFTRQIAEEVRDSGVQKALEPMSPPDRKVVHDTVNEIAGVRTLSEGEDSRRRVVILPE